MGMGGSDYDPAAQEAMMTRQMEKEREYRLEEREQQRMSRMEEEKLRISMERAAREEQLAAMQAEQEEIEEKEEEAIQEYNAQDRAAQNIMGFFTDRPGVQIVDTKKRT